MLFIMLFIILVIGIKMKRISKQEANYRSVAKVEHCRDCDMFVKPAACTLVIGTIYPAGHCKYWEAKNKLPVEKKS